jgi:DNA-binding response OmpR family regulator
MDQQVPKVLIVEDEPTIRSMYETKLELSGFAVEMAEDGHAGLAKAEAFMPDVILLDLRMPRMSGDEMLKHLRAKDWGSSMRVIILTNISRDEAPHALRFLVVDGYIVKAHTTPSQVVDIIDDVLDRKKGAWRK